jgi:hypothetical protein
LNELDYFVKQGLKEEYYLRYCDDFLILGNDPTYLADLIKPIEQFLDEKLCLSLHPNKVTIGKLNQGIDFLGYIVLPHYKVLRTKTKKRMFKKLKKKKREYKTGEIFKEDIDRSVQSYLGLLSHGENKRIQRRVRGIMYEIAIEEYMDMLEWIS